MKKCPKCFSSLKYSALDAAFTCERSACGFFISEAQMDKTLKQFYGPKLKSVILNDEDNLSALNNFGHKIRSEDYSDSI